MRRLLLPMLAMGIAVTLAGAPAARAQSCSVALPSCGGAFGAHYATAGYGQGDPTHGECMICQDNGANVEPMACHSCAAHFNDEEKVAYESALKAGRYGSVSRLLSSAAGVPTRVIYNARRSAVQIVAACDETKIIASLRVETAAQRRLAVALPRPSAQLRQLAVEE